MLKKRIITLVMMLLAGTFCLMAQEDNKQPTPDEMAEKEAERLGDLLKLEDWQLFYVDSTLRNDISEMMAEINKLQRARVENSDLYFAVQDKWVEATQNSYRKIFSDEQWAHYLKSGGQKIMNDRQKRRNKQAAGEKQAVDMQSRPEKQAAGKIDKKKKK